MYRYVCPNCLRTFLDSIHDKDRFCWKCGEHLQIIPNEVSEEKTNGVD